MLVAAAALAAVNCVLCGFLAGAYFEEGSRRWLLWGAGAAFWAAAAVAYAAGS